MALAPARRRRERRSTRLVLRPTTAAGSGERARATPNGRLLRFGSRARRDESGLEHVERLHRKLALRRRIRGDVDRLTRSERLPLAVDVRHDGIVSGSANHSDHQMTVADDPVTILNEPISTSESCALERSLSGGCC